MAFKVLKDEELGITRVFIPLKDITFYGVTLGGVVWKFLQDVEAIGVITVSGRVVTKCPDRKGYQLRVVLPKQDPQFPHESFIKPLEALALLKGELVWAF